MTELPSTGESRVPDQPSQSPPVAATSVHSPLPVTKGQGTVIIVLLCVVVVVAAVLAYVAANNQFSSPKYEETTSRPLNQLVSPTYEYKTLEFYTNSPNRQGAGAFKFSSVNIDTAQLNALGAKGWEVVGSYLEIETAWANFGSAKYVTGLQPNVRPQRLVVILQHRVSARD